MARLDIGEGMLCDFVLEPHSLLRDILLNADHLGVIATWKWTTLLLNAHWETSESSVLWPIWDCFSKGQRHRKTPWQARHGGRGSIFQERELVIKGEAGKQTCCSFWGENEIIFPTIFKVGCNLPPQYTSIPGKMRLNHRQKRSKGFFVESKSSFKWPSKPN